MQCFLLMIESMSIILTKYLVCKILLGPNKRNSENTFYEFTRLIAVLLLARNLFINHLIRWLYAISIEVIANPPPPPATIPCSDFPVIFVSSVSLARIASPVLASHRIEIRSCCFARIIAAHIRSNSHPFFSYYIDVSSHLSSYHEIGTWYEVCPPDNIFS